MKRYLLIRYQQFGMGAGARLTSVIEQANAAPAPEPTGRYTLDEAYGVAGDTPLHDWEQSLSDDELPAPLVPSEGGE